MPNWKKVIVSGSDAALNSINVSTNVVATSFTGSLQGTASFALTSSNVQGGDTNYIPIWNTATSLSSSIIYQSGGNVGIGTTSPGAKLEVGKNEAVNNQIQISTGVWNEPTLFFSSYSNFNYTLGNFGTSGSKKFQLRSNNGSVILSTGGNDSGDVGIGTTSPNAKLDVSGSAIISGSLTATAGLTVTGSLNVSAGITGSLQGTASWATNVVNSGVTSVATAGTVSGITLTGGTITSTGTITLGGSISGLTNSNLTGTAGITNANLANSSITIGSTATSLGGTSTTLAGLTSVTATSFIGSLSGTATAALTASKVVVKSEDSSAVDHYVAFTSGPSNHGELLADTGFRYQPSTNIIFATASNALSASIVTTVRTGSSATFYPTFVDSLNAAPLHEQLCTATSPALLSFVPSTGALTATSFTGSLQGTASLATTARTASFVNTITTANTAAYYLTGVDSDNGTLSPEQLYTFNGVTYNPDTSEMSIYSGLGTVLATAASASSVLAGDFAAGTYSVPWMSQKTPGIATYFEGDAILLYETATGRLNANTFVGALTGNATTATSATSASTHTITTNALHYPVFVDANNASPASEKLGTVAGYNFNPSTNRLAITGSLGVTAGITGSLQGTASYATMASQSGYTMQFVLATTGSNPVASTNYRLGAPMQNRLNTSAGRTRIYIPRPGKVRYAHIYVRTNGTLASAGTSTFYLSKNGAPPGSGAEVINTSTTTGVAADAEVSSTAVSQSVALGDYMEIVWGTPAWGTLPTAVEANAIIYIENNI